MQPVGPTQRSPSCLIGTSSLLESNTLADYRSLAEKHIRPPIDSVKVGTLDGDLFEFVLRHAPALPGPLRPTAASTTEPAARTSAMTAARQTSARTAAG